MFVPIKGMRRRKVEAATIAALAVISSVSFIPRDSFVAPAVARGASAAAANAAATAEAVAPSKGFSLANEVSAMASSLGAGGVSASRGTSSSRATLGLPNIEHPLVDTWVRRFTTSQRGSFAIYLNRMGKYEGMITKKLADRDMPRGLIFLAMIESGFNPTAKSPVKASGLWQFMSATGREYGLTVSRNVDERNNPARSTDAALRYLDKLHDRFGSWYLAAAAYNTGQGRVARIMKQETGSTRGTDEDYYRISHRLSQETRDYVPKMIAAARIGSDPAKYGFVAD
jgi:membrane-bound lytic murein transglycosylase D